MITYAANIEPLFPGKDIYEKIPLIRKAGISGIEFWSWADRDVKRIRELCEDQGVKVTAFSGQQDYSLCDGRKRSEYIECPLQCILTAFGGSEYPNAFATSVALNSTFPFSVSTVLMLPNCG